MFQTQTKRTKMTMELETLVIMIQMAIDIQTIG